MVRAIRLVMAVALAGCGGAEKPALADRIGQHCTVQFRRGDALGRAGDLPVSPTAGNINGADVRVRGTLKAVSANWVTVEDESAEYRIPRESILLVQFDK